MTIIHRGKQSNMKHNFLIFVSIISLMSRNTALLSNLGSIDIRNCDSDNIDQHVLLVVLDDECSNSFADRNALLLAQYPCFHSLSWDVSGLFNFENPFDEHHYLYLNISDTSCINIGDNNNKLPDLSEVCIHNLLFDEIFQIQTFTQDRFCELRRTSADALPDVTAFHLDILDGTYSNSYRYFYGTDAFATDDLVDIYILDTGIRPTHDEFDLHYDNQVRTLSDTQCYDEPIDEINTHGTFTAALAGGYNYGSSRGQTIFDVQVCNKGGGCNSGCAISRLENAIKNNIISRGRRAVINMSFGRSSASSTLKSMWENAIQDVINAGAIVISAAGNSNDEGCFWPSAAPNSIAVGAHDVNFQAWSNSNYGECITVWAAGSRVPSAVNSGDSQYGTSGGTSLSSPIVAGVIANWLLECEIYNYHEPCTYENVCVLKTLM